MGKSTKEDELQQPSIRELEAEVRRKALATYQREYDLVASTLHHLNLGTAKLHGASGDDAALLRRLALVSHFNSLRWGLDRLFNGYFRQSIALTRMASEHVSWARAPITQEEADKWKKAFQRNQFAKFGSALRLEGFEGAHAGRLYGRLSRYAHPSAVGFNEDASVTEWGYTFRMGPHYDAGALAEGLEYLLIVASWSLVAEERLQIELLGSVDAEWLESGGRVVSEINSAVQELERKAMAAGAKPVGELRA